jgi:hypothetical protein
MGFVVDEDETLFVEHQFSIDYNILENIAVLLLDRQQPVEASVDASGLETLAKLVALQVLLRVNLKRKMLVVVDIGEPALDVWNSFSNCNVGLGFVNHEYGLGKYN